MGSVPKESLELRAWSLELGAYSRGGKMEGMGGWERGEKQGEGGFGRALDVWAVWG